ncbi:MAG: helicase-related protein [Deltaproteobacteria bacterium]|nr:helicase-related protein [Deltaproteobacteria bacterium]
MSGHFAGAGAVAAASTPPPALDFNGEPAAASAVAEAQRLAHGHLFNPAFASEISRIDPLPHQRIAVYERMMLQQPLRFLLADDAGAGKTIMAGLFMREMLSRDRIRRILVAPPAGLVGNWERELRTLFQLPFQIVTGDSIRNGNPFAESGSDLVIVSVDTLAREKAFGRLREAGQPYDLVVFDEAHKLAASRRGTRMQKTQRYLLAEALAGIHSPAEEDSALGALGWAARHLLLLTATPHMGRDYPYYCLWRLLNPEVFGSEEAFRQFPVESRARYFIRRTKEEMIGLDGQPLYPPRVCGTFSYDLSPGEAGEQALYEATNRYLRNSYDRAQQSNRPAARLAVGVFQRRLASSTWALLRSFERRIEKLQNNIERLQSGAANSRSLEAEQKEIESKFIEDFFETHGADDDEREGFGGEAHEEYEIAVLGATVAVTIEELQREIAELEKLRNWAKALCDLGDESKFNKLQEVLQNSDFAEEKWLIFTEHRDTADYLVRRLEGLGFAGQVAQIHGGMAWPEREEQVEQFRNPQGARYMIATDAAGEGINLQFCRLMANYDLPWNPARLEQRMGRIHRYGQKHTVHIFNLVAGGTREGQVLKSLLEKLEAIRSQLRSDKVFDVIGRLFENISLSDYMTGALTEEGAQKARAQIEGKLTAEQMNALKERERSLYGKGGEVKASLGAIQRGMAQERYLHLLPGYVRGLVENAAALLGLEIAGDLDGEFAFSAKRRGALDPLQSALQDYSAEEQRRICIRRPEPGAPCIWLHPGEQVFDALCGEVMRRFGREALRGAIFTDPRATAPSLFHLAAATIEWNSGEAAGAQRELIASTSRPLARHLLALRQNEDGELSECAIEHLLLLRPAAHIAPGAIPLAARAASLRGRAAEHAAQMISARAEERREELRAGLPERMRQVKIGLDHRRAELSRRYGKLLQSSDRDESEIARTKQQLNALKEERQRALNRLEAEPARVAPGAPRFFVHALVVPGASAEEAAHYDARVEEIAVRIATAWERERGAVVEDVSRPELARAAGLRDWPGFDLRSRQPQQPSERLIEVKGRAGEGGVELSENEWSRACNLRGSYWLYVVFDCATPRPRLLRIQDPFRRLLLGASERTRDAVSFSAARLREAAERATEVGKEA